MLEYAMEHYILTFFLCWLALIAIVDIAKYVAVIFRGWPSKCEAKNNVQPNITIGENKHD